MRIKYVWDFNKALAAGKYAWPGGYPIFFITVDGGALSFDAAIENADLIRDAVITQDTNSGWCVCAAAVNWEDSDLVCDHTGNKIESAYGGE